MTPSSKAKNLKALREKMDSGKLTPTHADSHRQSVGFTHAWTAPHHINCLKHEDALFISQAANDIVEIVDYVERLENALQFYAAGGNFSKDVWLHKELGYFTGKRARAVLSGGE